MDKKVLITGVADFSALIWFAICADRASPTIIRRWRTAL